MFRKYMPGLFLVLLTGLLCIGEQIEAQDLVFIAHKNITASLKKEEFKQVFLRKKTRWEDDLKITFVICTESQTYARFLKEFVKKTSSQYTNYWKKQVFTGKGRMPKMFRNSQELLDFVANTEGAISFMSVQDVDRSRVNILIVRD